jgi:hypothetical protein
MTRIDSLLAISQDWDLFKKALHGASSVAEQEFRRLPIPARLKLLVASGGESQIVDEINAHFRGLGVSHENGFGGFDCARQEAPARITVGWEVDPDRDPVFVSVDPCRLLPALARLADKAVSPGGAARFAETRKRVRRAINRCS